MIWSAVVMSIGVMLFTVPFRLPDAGFTGIAVLLNYTFGISVPAFVWGVNALLLLWAWRELSRRFVVWTAVYITVSSLLMKFADYLPEPDVTSVLVVALIGGALKGHATGVAMNIGASTGGTDVIAIYLRNKYGMEVGKISFYFNIVVISASVFIVGAELAMIGLVSIYASTVVIDNTMSAFDRRRQVFVIARDTEAVVNYITHTLNRGATVIDAVGGYSGAKHELIYLLLTKRQTVELRHFIAERCPEAFMVVSDASEVIGKGFKPWRQS